MKQFRCSKKLVRKFYPWKCFSEILPSLTIYIYIKKVLGNKNVDPNINCGNLKTYNRTESSMSEPFYEPLGQWSNLQLTMCNKVLYILIQH